VNNCPCGKIIAHDSRCIKEHIINKIKIIIEKLLENNNIPNNDKFPSKEELKDYYAVTNLRVLVEQGQLLIEKQITSTIQISDNDYNSLEKLFLEDAELFLTVYHEELNIQLDKMIFSQFRLPSDTLNHILNSRVFNDSYKTVDLLNQCSVYDMYSLPFLIRITIETQIKSIIGFKSILKSTLPISKTIDFLIENNNSVSISEIALKNAKNIYSWSSSFIHTGEKEPIWLILKALQQIQELFKHEEKSSQFIGQNLNYLTIEIENFQDRINEYLFPNNRNRIELSKDNFEINNKFYDNVKKIWI